MLAIFEQIACPIIMFCFLFYLSALYYTKELFTQIYVKLYADVDIDMDLSMNYNFTTSLCEK